MPPRSVFGVYVVVEYSARRPMTRSTRSPQVCSLSVENRIWLKGMRYSAVHPPSSTVVATSQTASHELSSDSWPEPVADLTASRCTPEGFTSKVKPVR